jgi:hypothetical protein
MGRSIPPEWTVNLLSMGKEPWKFKDLDDQMSTYHQQWQADQQTQIMLNMSGKSPGRSSDNNNSGRNSNHQKNSGRGGCGRG